MDSLNMLAYLDPGTGAMILQMVIAGVLTTGVVFRRALFYVPALLFGNKSTKETPEAEKPSEPPSETN